MSYKEKIDGTSGKGVQGCVGNCIRLIYVIKRKSYVFQRVSLPVGGILLWDKIDVFITCRRFSWQRQAEYFVNISLS